MQELSDAALRGSLELLSTRLTCDVVLLRTPDHWRPEKVRRVLVPIRGSGTHSSLRARLLANLRHRAAPEQVVIYMLVLPTTTTEVERARRERAYTSELRLEGEIPAEVHTVLSDDVPAAIIAAAEDSDLLVLGLTRVSHSERVFSEVTRKIIASTICPALVISQRG